METLHNINEQFDTLISEKRYLDLRQFNDFLNKLSLEIQVQEKLNSRNEIVKDLEEIRNVCSRSPFIKRAQTWPRGYQGDFETIDYIMKAENQAQEGSFEYLVEDYFLKSDICQQHRNKVARQAQMIKETIREKSDAKIISIGCGTSADIKTCIDEITCSNCQITLVDVDQNALAYSMKQLEEIGDRITPLHGNIYKLMRNLSEEYDLILIGGVFDYLNDKTIVSILQSLRSNLTDGGKVFFTNINKNNRYRIFMEYISDWFLIERSESHLEELITGAEWPDDSYHIVRDKTGLTHLVELRYRSDIPSGLATTERHESLVSVC